MALLAIAGRPLYASIPVAHTMSSEVAPGRAFAGEAAIVGLNQGAQHELKADGLWNLAVQLALRNPEIEARGLQNGLYQTAIDGIGSPLKRMGAYGNGEPPQMVDPQLVNAVYDAAAATVAFRALGARGVPPLGAVAADSAAKGGGRKIFRVVNDAEQARIQATQKFEFLPNSSTPTGEAGKFFWGGMSEAERFQPYWYRSGENSHIISTTLAPDSTPILFPHTDGIGTAIWVPMKDLTAPVVFH
jgi:hypothetical protein